jgi:hypothetical protein
MKYIDLWVNKQWRVRKQEQEKDEIFPKPGEKVTTDAKKFMERIKVIVGKLNFILQPIKIKIVVGVLQQGGGVRWD